jgi:hypothetical protein
MKKRIGLLLFVVLVLAPFALVSQNVQADRQLPANQPSLGMLYDGLEVAGSGPCKGALRVKGGPAAREHCTHGPEVAPAKMNLKASPAPMTGAPQTAAAAATTTVTCDGDGVSGKRVQVIYAHPAGTADQYATYKTSFQQWAAEVDYDYNISAAQTGSNRHVRYVHDASCTPSIIDVALSSSGASDFASTINELDAKGYNRTDRKYMIFMDAHVYCGISDVNVDDQAGTANLSNSGPNYARIDGGCWSGVIAAHELMHNLGGVQLTAPHNDGNFHCTEGYDNMCDHSGHSVTTLCTNSAGDSWFDCNHDDYYSTSPASGSYLATHWNTANNQFLFKTVGVPSAVTISDIQAHPATSDPTQSATGDLTTILAAFSGLAFLALYALYVILSGSREAVNA